MIHIIYIYLIINSFIAGYLFNNNYKWEKIGYTLTVSFSAFLFGIFGYLFYFLILFFAPILGWIVREVKFTYRFYCTDYWDKIMLDDNYSETYKTTKEKLERSAKVVRTASKQLKRHNRLIQKRYV